MCSNVHDGFAGRAARGRLGHSDALAVAGASVKTRRRAARHEETLAGYRRRVGDRRLGACNCARNHALADQSRKWLDCSQKRSERVVPLPPVGQLEPGPDDLHVSDRQRPRGPQRRLLRLGQRRAGQLRDPYEVVQLRHDLPLHVPAAGQVLLARARHVPVGRYGLLGVVSDVVVHRAPAGSGLVLGCS